jgi:hypothetical protein
MQGDIQWEHVQVVQCSYMHGMVLSTAAVAFIRPHLQTTLGMHLVPACHSKERKSD